MADQLSAVAWVAGVGLVALLVLFVAQRWCSRERERKAARVAIEAGAAERARRAKSPPRALRRASSTRHPILLAHGWCGFDRIGLSEFGHDYFRGVPRRLQALGHAVHVARVSPIASIELRAAQLARQVERLDARVNIIAHSMGGLDARVAIARHGLGERVASLTTIGTPHHGTPLADLAWTFGEWRALRRALARLGINVDGLYDVSTLRMRDFNSMILDSPEVLYSSVVGAVNLSTVGVHALLLPGHRYLLRKAGPNDGIVPATSQLWGEPLDEVDADHWAQIGWSQRFDVRAFYARLVDRLVERGL